MLDETLVARHIGIACEGVKPLKAVKMRYKVMRILQIAFVYRLGRDAGMGTRVRSGNVA